MRHILCGFALALAVVASFGQALATPIIYTATLTGGQEVPPNGSAATGFTTVSFDQAAHLLHVDLTFSGLTVGATAAHIHAPAPPGVNAGVAVFFTGFPFGATSGTYSHDFDMSLDATFNLAFRNTYGGGTAAGAENALGSFLAQGLAYANIHDQNFPGGEIRGQLAVPEPASLLLLGSAMVGSGVVARLKKKA